MTAQEIFNTIQPLVTRWNADHYRARLAMVEEDELITISPVERDCRHLPGTLLTDIALLASVYGWTYGVHTTIHGAPFILL